MKRLRPAALAVSIVTALAVGAVALPAAGRSESVIHVRFGPDERVFTPTYFNAVDSDVLRICNRTPLRLLLFSLSPYKTIGAHRTFAKDLRVLPAACVQVALHNPTARPIRVIIGVETSSNAFLKRDPGSGQCVLDETTTKQTVEKTIQLPPDKSRTHSVIASVAIFGSARSVSRALLIGLCDPAKGETAPNC